MNILFPQNLLRSSLILAALNVIFFAPLSAQTEKTSDEAWTRIESFSKDFSIAIPTGEYLAYNQKGKIRIWYTHQGRSVTVSMEKNGNAKQMLKTLVASSHDPRFRTSDAPEYQTIQLDDFLGRWYTNTSEKSGSEYYSFDIASSHGWYSITVRAPKGSSEFTQRFLGTARLGGKPLINSKLPDVRETKTVSIDSLPTSDVVAQALKQPAPASLKLEKYLTIDSPKEPDTSIYSRDLIVLSKPRPSYTDDARQRNIQGKVALMVEFRSNGTIGSIHVVNSLGGGLDGEAFEVAKQIKFLPAEIDGKPVDLSRRMEFSFTIY